MTLNSTTFGGNQTKDVEVGPDSCFNSSMPNSGKISVEALSKKNRMEAAMFFLNNTEDT
jgi:hypothetical protein